MPAATIGALSANSLAVSGPSSATSYSTSGTTQGITAWSVGTGTITGTLPTNYVGFAGPASGTPAYFLQLPAASPSGQVLSFAAPSTVNGVSQSVGSWITPALTTNPLSQFAATTSAQLASVISDESGTGALLFAGGNIGAATGISLSVTGGFATSAGTSYCINGDVGLARVVAGKMEIASNCATPNATGTLALGSLLATGVVDGQAPTTIITTGTQAMGATTQSGYYINENATTTTAVSGTLPTAAAGKQFCLENGWNGTAATTGVLTLSTSATGQFIIFTDGTLSATGGNITSGGAAADMVCVHGVDATHWQMGTVRGTWAKH
jgi:hypothetical protein